MAKKTKFIPFNLLPASWGLVGRVYDEAEAHYYFDGEDLDLRLAEIANPNKKSIEYLSAVLEVSKKYGKIADWDYDSAKALYANGGEVDPDQQAKIDLKHGKISQYDYDMLQAPNEHAQSLVKLKHGLLTQFDFDMSVAETDNDRLRVLYNHGKISEFDYDLGSALTEYEVLDAKLKHGKISQYDYDMESAKLDEYLTDQEKEQAFLTVDFKHGKMTQFEYDKAMATAKGEPWVAVVDNSFDPSKGINGIFFKFDWNERWIEELRLNGYIGRTDEELVEQWFSDVCRDNAGIPFDDEPVPFNSNRFYNNGQNGRYRY
jgi:hypothetical protein